MNDDWSKALAKYSDDTKKREKVSDAQRARGREAYKAARKSGKTPGDAVRVAVDTMKRGKR